MLVDKTVVKALIRKNGLLWTASFLTNAALRKSLRVELRVLDRAMLALERWFNLPGIADVELARCIWNKWDWSRSGEEWTAGEAWKQSLVDTVLRREIHHRGTILEIGPGAGRWTEHLLERADRLILVDLSSRCIELCRSRFGHLNHVSFHVNDGTDLSFVDESSVDFVWSFDVFVHISPEGTDAYLAGLRRVMKAGGKAMIHHPRSGGLGGGCRSRVTSQLFAELLRKNQLSMIRQFNSWSGSTTGLGCHEDAITIFTK